MKFPSEHELVADLVARYLAEADESGGAVSIEDVCSDHPDLVESVRRSVKIAGDLADMQSAERPTDRLIRSLLVGRYQITGRLGSGAMGVVYAANDLDLGRPVAIKVVHSGLMERSTALERFEREAAALAAIRHESVVTIFDRGVTDDGSPFFVMEHLDGIPCSEILELAKTRVTEADETQWLTTEAGLDDVLETSYVRQMVRWAASLASGLAAAHEAGVYHRDIKPSNIMIRRDGSAVLLDFGIATRDDAETLTRTDAAVGTPAYMAPETLVRHTKAGAELDVYGLAATLYHMLTLRPPYEGSPVEVLSALATREAVPAFKLRPGLPRDAQAILDHGMARSAGSRYGSVLAMEKDLRALLAFQPVSVRPTSTVTRAVRRLRRSRLFLGAAAALLLVAAGFGLRQVQLDRLLGRIAAHGRAQAELPANLGIVKYSNRAYAEPEDIAAIRAVLDRLVAAGHDRVPALAMRAAFRLDHGDGVGAAEDMGTVKGILGTDYATALAGRYAELPDTSTSAKDLVLDDLPEPVGPLDGFLVGFHLMRKLRYEEAAPWLEAPGLEDVRLARELALTTTLVELMGHLRAEEWEILYRKAGTLLLRTKQVEIDFGGSSAATRHLRCAAYIMQYRNAAARAEAERGLALSPYSYVTLVNAAEAALRTGDLDAVQAFSEQGLRLLPHYYKFWKSRFDAARDSGQYELARELIDRAFEHEEGNSTLELTERIHVDLDEAYSLISVDLERARELCASVISKAKSGLQGHDSQAAYISSAAAIATAEPGEILEQVLETLEGRPLDLRLIEDVTALMAPENGVELNYEQEQALLAWLVELELALSRHSRIDAPDPE